MVRCDHCGKVIWPWTQDVSSYGPIGHSRRTADSVSHGRCIREASRRRHMETPHRRRAVCGLWQCTNIIEEE